MSDTAAQSRKPKVFAFVNGINPMGYMGAAIAEDGTVLPVGHCSSSAFWAFHDMGAGGSKWKHDEYAKHYPDGFEVEWVENVREHPVLWPLIERLNAEAKSDEATGRAA